MKTRSIILAVALAAAAPIVLLPVPALAQHATNAVVAVQRPTTITASGAQVQASFTNINYQGFGTFILVCTNWGGGTPTHDCKLTESTDNSAWSDVTGGAFTQVTTSNAVQALNFWMTDRKKYLRFTNTITGSSVSNVYSIVFIGPQKYR